MNKLERLKLTLDLLEVYLEDIDYDSTTYSFHPGCLGLCFLLFLLRDEGLISNDTLKKVQRLILSKLKVVFFMSSSERRAFWPTFKKTLIELEGGQ